MRETARLDRLAQWECGVRLVSHILATVPSTRRDVCVPLDDTLNRSSSTPMNQPTTQPAGRPARASHLPVRYRDATARVDPVNSFAVERDG